MTRAPFQTMGASTSTVQFGMIMMDLHRARLVWYVLLAGTGSLLVLAFLPPFLSGEMQAVVRRCFAPVCHQMPSRSLHVGGVPLAVCDRCTGIYLGLPIGVASVGWGRRVWKTLGAHGRYLLLGSLVPLGIDWIGPILGLWGNGPVSRILTGVLFGSVATSYVTDRLLHRVARTTSPEGPRQG